MQNDAFLRKLENQKEKGLFRTWGPNRDPKKIDFYSNDYLGFANNPSLNQAIADQLIESEIPLGSSGSRLVSGNSDLLESLEEECSQFFNSEAAIFFPNGYMANLALLSSVASRHDTIIYDEQAHVSLKDGIRLSQASRFSFRHNDPEDLNLKLSKGKGLKFVVAESIYSMDGDTCPLQEILEICEKHNAHLIVDEAHSTGVLGESGKGLCCNLGLENRIWARIYTFGKALGASGAIMCINKVTQSYLTNFSHPLIYSTAPLPFQILVCHHQLRHLQNNPEFCEKLDAVISTWNSKNQDTNFTVSKNLKSPVQYVIISGNEKARAVANHVQSFGIQVKAMLSPTIPIGKERLRISLHAFNSEQEIDSLFVHIREFENIFEITI